jgi:hypothetical protein
VVAIGIASGQREVLSMTVNWLVKPFDEAYQVQVDVTGTACGDLYVLRQYLDMVYFGCWQCRQALAQAVTSMDRPFHT